MSSKAPKSGVYVPTCTFFKNTAEQELDLETQKKHSIRLASAGITGIIVQGSNGEAVHLDPEERREVIKAIRSALNENGFPNYPLIAGTGAASLKETLRLTHDAANAGADYVIVLPPSYFVASMSKDALKYYFTSVANASSVPVMIYNYPGVSAGIDLDSDFLFDLAQHPNIVGVKLTCASVGKLTRLVLSTNIEEFAVFGGQADFLVASLAVGSAGCIGGVCNIAPKASVEIFRSYQKGDIQTAKKAQKMVAMGERVMGLYGVVPSTKFALQSFFGYGGLGRRPIPELTSEQQTLLTAELKELIEYEKSLPDT